ncbi:transposase [Bradyrhizobium sp. JYMT SZCCT0428]|uniref:transposase n=1 Tax=Bradyrhizobium sp. JYMT SZCCT0428 TaxID=2807673 RepID=UPI001BA6FFF5|nr:transposase [Bradyrhizobium sp. JYMT SZCCT0428]MBR1157087.1 transposase [Bradyrhizobium sp. JYMT SZCCT0428]
MMGPRQVDQAALFYEFSLERHVPAGHLLRAIDRFVDLSEVQSHQASFYSSTGRPSIDPELLVRMLLVGYCYGIRSERRLCEEVHLNLAYRWFCRLGCAHKGHAFFAYADNYLIDLKAAIIVDVEATRAIRQAEVGAARTMIERTNDCLGLCPERLAADSAYGSAEMLGWLVNERAIEPHIPVFDKSARDDGTFARGDFDYNQEADIYVCPAGKVLSSTGTLVNDGATLLYRASKYDCDACELKPRCCPKMPARKVPRSIHEQARDVARDIAKTDAYVRSRRERKKIEMLFAHLKRILRLDRLRLRGPFGAQDEFLLAATAQNLRKLAKLIPLPAPMPA